MSNRRWFKAILSTLTRDPRRAGRSGSPYLRPQLECLEDRCAPAVLSEFSSGITGTASAGITTGPDGNLWFTEEGGGGRIGRITPAGVITEFSTGITPGSVPFDIVTGPDGNLWFPEAKADKIGRITPDGVVTEFGTGITAGSSPEGIAVGPDGRLWFTENDGDRIGRITTSGQITEFSTNITPNCRPFGITAGPDGNLWFCEDNADKIGRITTTGTITEFSTGITAGSTPSRITTGPDGNLWFTEFNGARIARITLSGSVKEFSAGIAAGSFPGGITAGPDGNLWFCELGSGVIGHISTTGVVTPVVTVSSTNEPNVITPGPDGNLWLTETTANKIARVNLLSAVGAPLSIATGQTFSGVLASVTPLDPTTPANELQAVIDWGDGTAYGGIVTGTPQAGFSVTGTHTYDRSGSFIAAVTISDAGSIPLGLLAPSTTAPVPVMVHTLADPGFEIPAVHFGHVATAPAASPWSFSGAAGVASNGSSLTSANPPAPGGNQVAFLKNTGVMAQTFTLPAGAYSLHLLAAQSGASGTKLQTISVSVDGAVISNLTPASTSYAALTTNTFTVEGGFHTIRIKGLNAKTTALVDNVQLNLVAVIADPGFEVPAIGSAVAVTAPAGSPWIFAGKSGYAANKSTLTSSNPPAPQGKQVLFLEQGNAIAQQDIDFAGGAYTIGFQAAQRGSGNAHDQTFRVLLDNAVISSFNNFTGSTYALQLTSPFNVQAGVHTLAFVGTDLNGGDCTVLIDQVSVIAQITSISDPGFTVPAQAAGSFTLDPTGSPWTFTGTAGITANNSSFTTKNPPAPLGRQAAVLQQTGAFSQNITLVAGTYALDFFAAQRGTVNPGTQTFRVLIDGIEVGRFTPNGTSYAFWTTSTFTATAGAHVVRFEGLNPKKGDNTALIDDVFVSATG
jgi:streptogramin lyase